MELGGAYDVRAYPEGEAYGDQGYILTAEARWLLPRMGLPGRLQLIGFGDTGSVTLDKNPWAAGENRATRSGAGVGATWTADADFIAKVSYAHKLGDQPATSARDAPGRLWIQVAKFF